MSASDVNDPGNPENKHRTRESQRQLRGLLMEWDPIGVAGVSEAADEYDCMISPLLHRLHDGATQDEIRDWIVGEVRDTLKCSLMVIEKARWPSVSSSGGAVA